MGHAEHAEEVDGQLVGGALLGVLQLAGTQAGPSHVDRTADEMAVNLLRMFGVPHDEARAIASAKLPRTG